MSDQKHVKVLIAGGSVAGLTLANILEQLGIDYLVLEKYGKIAPDMGTSIEPPNEKFAKYSSQNIQGQKCSYLVATGPNHRIYWFLFKKLPDVTRGLYDKTPRFADEQRDALATEHANDFVSDTLTFGEL